LALTACADQSLESDGAGPTNNQNTSDAGFNNGGGGSGDAYVPEQEEEFEFSAPAVVGDQVYVANETLNSVAVIDSRNLSISTRLVGFRPTQIVGPDAERVEPADDARVMVLNEGSQSVSILATDGEEVVTVPVMSRANSIEMDPTGTSGVVWYDPQKAKASDPAGDLSSVSVVQESESYQLSVGFHVRDVFFDDAGERALVLSDDGVSLIDLTSLSGDAIAPPTPVVPPEYQYSQPEDLEVLVSDDAQWAITRSASFEGAVLLEVDTGKHHFLPLPEIPTDIDLIDGDDLEVLIMLRTEGKAVRASIPEGFTAAAEAMDVSQQIQANGTDAGSDAGMDAGMDAGADIGVDTGADTGSMDVGNADTGSTDTGSMDVGSTDTGSYEDTGQSADPFTFPMGIDGFEVFDVEVAGLGAASVALDGDTALLFTTLDAEKRAVLFDLQTDEQRTLVFEKGVRGAISDRNGETFLVLHSKVDGSIPPGTTPADPEYIARSWGVSVVDVASAASRLVLTKHEPGQATLWAPEEADSKVFLIFEAPEALSAAEPSHRDVLTINLRSFRTDSFRVPSLPEGLGPIRSAGKIYISQRHPQGRMTFVDAATEARQTITGYQLNAGID
jgi:DNA-binding beta-propeller fold protein YncE